MWMISPVALAGVVWNLIRNSLGALLGSVLGLAMLSLCALTLAGRFATPPWPYDLANHFTLHYAVCLGIALLFTLVRRPATPVGWLIATLSLGCLAFNVWRLLPYAPPPQAWGAMLASLSPKALALVSPALEGIPAPVITPPGPKPQGPTLSLLHLNVQGVLNKDIDRTLALVVERQPDVALFSEFNTHWEKAFAKAPALKPWCYRMTGRAHLAVYSKRPLKNMHYAYLEAPVANQTWLRCDVAMGRQPVTLVLAHLPLPAVPAYFEHERAMLSTIAAQRGQYRPAWVLVGDLNMTPWSALFGPFLAQSGLRDSQWGRGVQASWPAWAPSLLAIPIDHVLHSDRLDVLERAVSEPVGSDHRAVWAQLTAATP